MKFNDGMISMPLRTRSQRKGKGWSSLSEVVEWPYLVYAVREDKVDEAGDGSLLVRINPTDCKVPQARGVGLPFGAREGLERIAAALEKLSSECKEKGRGECKEKGRNKDAKAKAKPKAKSGK